MAALLRQVRRKLQPRKIVLVNPSATGDPVVEARAQQLNVIINQFVNGRTVQLINWAAILPKHPGRILPADPLKIHLTPFGRYQRAGLYLAALRRLR